MPRTERRPSFAERKAAADERRERRAAVEDPGVVMEAAAGFLSVRPRSVAETRRRLRHLGYPHQLSRPSWSGSSRWTTWTTRPSPTAWVESRDRARPRGETALRRELSLKGIDRETVTAVLEERSSPEDGSRDADAPTPDRVAAEHLLARKRAALLREPDPRKRRQKAYALLARNGFGPDVCREVAATIDSADGLVDDET